MDAALVVGAGGVEVKVGVDLLLLDHPLLDVLGNGHDGRSTVLGFGQLDGVLFDDVAAGVVFFVDAVAETHHEFFGFPLGLQKGVGILH